MHVFQVFVIFLYVVDNDEKAGFQIESNRVVTINVVIIFLCSTSIFIEFLYFDKKTDALNSHRSQSKHTRDHFDDLFWTMEVSFFFAFFRFKSETTTHSTRFK